MTGEAALELRDPASLPIFTGLPGPLGGWALFIDFDGTLVDIAPRPDAVVVPPELLAALAGLYIKLEGALAIVTGRRLSDIDHLLGPIGIPVAAMHGAVLRLGGETLAAPEAVAVPDRVAEELLELVEAHPGLLLEPKDDSLAVHFRNAPHLGDLVQERVAALVAQHAPGHDIQPGKMVFEIKPRGVNKGRAIESLLRLPAFESRRPAVFGDDLTDEAGFITALGHDGLATLIGEPERKTAATSRLGSPAELRDWLLAISAS